MIQERLKILTCKWIRLDECTGGYRFRADAVIFPYMDRVFTLNMSDFLIDGLSHSCYVYPELQQESQIFFSSSFQGKEVGRWILIFRDSCLIRAPILMILSRMVSNWAEAHSVLFKWRVRKVWRST